MATSHLQELLQKTLKQHIKDELPPIRQDLSLRLSRMEQELKQFDEPIAQSQASGSKFYIVRYVNEFIKNVEVDIMGCSDEDGQEKVGTKSCIKLHTEINKFIEIDVVPDETYLAILITNCRGLRNSISVPSISIDALCKRLVNKFKDPLEKTLNTVKDILLDSVVDMARVMDKYPSLKNEVISQMRSCITKRTDFTRDILLEHIEAEKYCVNIGHPDYISEACDQLYPAVGPTGTEAEEGPVVPEEMPAQIGTQKEVQYTMVLIAKYMKIVQKQISDITAKYIYYFLIKKVLDFIKIDLVPSLLTSPNLASLTEDCEDYFQQKQEIEMTVRVLKEALDATQTFET